MFMRSLRLGRPRPGRPGASPGSEGGWRELAEIRVGKDESLDSALRRFKRQVKRSGILSEAKRHEHYETPGQKRRRKIARSAKRRRR